MTQGPWKVLDAERWAQAISLSLQNQQTSLLQTLCPVGPICKQRHVALECLVVLVPNKSGQEVPKVVTLCSV